MKTFNLPDLGEGLPDAEIVRWLVKEGDTVALDQPMVEMETAKAVVEVPSPYKGKITKLCGMAGDVIDVGTVLVEFDGENSVHADDISVTKASDVKPTNSDDIVDTETNISSHTDVFCLPDLGEGLPDAEIVRWLVAEGDILSLDQPMVEMETAKAVVEVPSPFAAKVIKLHGQAGDVIDVGSVLVSYGSGDNTASNKATFKPKEEVQKEERLNQEQEETSLKNKPVDAATVVGAVQVGNQVVSESVNAVIKALAKKLKVDLTQVIGSGANGLVTQSDVKQAKKEGKLLGNQNVLPTIKTHPNQLNNNENPLDFRASPAVRAHALRVGVLLSQCKASGKKGTITKADVDVAIGSAARSNTEVSHSSSRSGVNLPTIQVSVEPQAVRGVRRAMAMGMAKAHVTVVPTTLVEDADITGWAKQDSLARYVRALVFASKIEPALNCWFDGDKFERLVHPNIHVGIAIDSQDGLYVPVIHDADKKDGVQVRARVQELRQKIENKALKQEDQQGATISLSNFGSIAGRYGTPVVSPPQVAILGTGRFRDELKLTNKGIENRKMLPLSLTFDHRACTGGEAARFLAAIIEDLQKNI